MKFNILNFFKNKPIEKKPHFFPAYPRLYEAQIVLEIHFLNNKLEDVYRTISDVKSESKDEYNKLIDEKMSEFCNIILNIHKDLNKSTSNYIMIDHRLLIHKSDFINARIIREVFKNY